MNKTHMALAMEIADAKAKYDAEVKNILADKNILAWILKTCASEFKRLEIEEIINCIEGEPEISVVPVYPGKAPEKITGMSTEDKVPNEGFVTYDIRFYAYVSKDGRKEKIKLIVNIEAQKKYHPGYDLVTRCIFYLARQISAQLDTEFTADDYDNIKKVYSIWICMDTPEYAQNTITKYDIQQTKIAGDFRGKARYDLMTGIMICLGKEVSDEKNSLLRLLGTVLAEKILPKEKEEILQKEYGIEMKLPSKEGLNVMCNLSDLIEERGIEKGMEQGLQQGRMAERISKIQKMIQKNYSKEDILDLDYTEEEYVKAREEMEKKA